MKIGLLRESYILLNNIIFKLLQKYVLVILRLLQQNVYTHLKKNDHKSFFYQILTGGAFLRANEDACIIPKTYFNALDVKFESLIN